MRYRSICSLVPLVLVLYACSYIPGLPQYAIKHAQEDAAKDLIDPSSVQWRNVAVHNGSVCGELNAKNRMGAYTGFVRWFAIKTPKNDYSSFIDPQFNPSELSNAKELCSSMQGNSYASVSSAVEECQQAEQMKAKEQLQELFDEEIKKKCDS